MDKRQAKQPRKISRQYLENAALYYLQRYATSSENLRRVLRRKVDRSCAFHQTPPEEFYPEIDGLILRYLSSGLLDDKGYARARTSSLRRQGKSKQAILAKLQSKGLPKNEIDAALRATDAEKEEDAELAAAVALARRKKLGPFRSQPAPDVKARQKDLAALGRAGFSYDTARLALQDRDEEESL